MSKMILLLAYTFNMIQLPPGTRNPDDNEPVDLSDPFDLIVFVILPILMVALYIYWKKKRKNGK